MRMIRKLHIPLAVCFIAGLTLCLLAASSAAAASSAEKTQRTLEQETFLENGVVYLPLKEVAPLLDLQVLWNREKSSVEVTGLYQALHLKVGQSKAYTSQNKVILLGAPVIIRSGVAYVPDKLFSKAFHFPVSRIGDRDISVPYTEKYLKSAAGNRMFWLHKQAGVIYSGTSGSIPSRAGTANVHSLDWASLSSRAINGSSSLLELQNSFGEPHINDSRYRFLLHEGKLVRQAHTTYGGARNLRMKEDVPAFRGQLVMMDHNILSLVNPDGSAGDVYNLTDITGIDDAFAVEAVESEFLLVRPFQKGTLFLIERQTKESSLLYPQFLGAEDQASLESYQVTDVDYPGDGLQYTGRIGNTLSFEWTSFTGGKKINFLLELTNSHNLHLLL